MEVATELVMLRAIHLDADADSSTQAVDLHWPVRPLVEIPSGRISGVPCSPRKDGLENVTHPLLSRHVGIPGFVFRLSTLRDSFPSSRNFDLEHDR